MSAGARTAALIVLKLFSQRLHHYQNIPDIEHE